MGSIFCDLLAMTFYYQAKAWFDSGNNVVADFRSIV
jgi:hypothetical protein